MKNCKCNCTVTVTVTETATVTETVTLDANTSYILNSSYIVQDGGKLIIPAGTKITARDGGTGVYIAVLKGGEIDIQGTSTNPVVIASSSEKGGSGIRDCRYSSLPKGNCLAFVSRIQGVFKSPDHGWVQNSDSNEQS